MVDDNYNARSTTPVTSTSVTTVIHVDRNSGYATVHTLDNACKENNNNQKIRPPSPSGGTLFINTKVEDEPRTQFFNQQPLMKEALIPFSNMLKKFRKTSNSGRYSSDTSANDQPKFSSSNTISETLDDSGEYVTITDVRNNNKPDPSPECTPQRSGVTEPACESTDPTWESLEYVSLNELPVSNPTELQPSAILSGSSNESSLERKRRQGARVTLDSEGKVVYSSDSLRRRKGAHTTFAPGQHVKDPSTSPSPSPVANHRTPKAIIRPVQSQASSTLQECYNRNKSDIRSSMKGVIDSDVTVAKPSKSQADEKVVEIRSPLNLNELPVRSTINARKAMNLSQSSDLFNQRNKVIIRAGISSPTKELPKSSSNGTARSLSPRSVLVTRGAYVHMQPDNQSSVKNHPAFLQTDFDGPDDSISPTIAPLRTEKHSEGKKVNATNNTSLTVGNGLEGDACKNQKVKRSASYRMANFSPLITVCDVDINKDQGGGDVDLGVADLGEPTAKLCLSPVVPNNNVDNVRNVFNPNAVGRRFYGAQVMVRPNILLTLSPNRVTKPSDTQKAKVLSTSGNDTEIW